MGGGDSEKRNNHDCLSIWIECALQRVVALLFGETWYVWNNGKYTRCVISKYKNIACKIYKARPFFLNNAYFVYMKMYNFQIIHHCRFDVCHQPAVCIYLSFVLFYINVYLLWFSTLLLPDVSHIVLLIFILLFLPP